MKITVTQKHIDKSLAALASTNSPSVARGCPLARAISEATGLEALMGTPRADLYGDGKRDRLPLPAEAILFRIALDRKQSVTPFSFTLKGI